MQPETNSYEIDEIMYVDHERNYEKIRSTKNMHLRGCVRVDSKAHQSESPAGDEESQRIRTTIERERCLMQGS